MMKEPLQIVICGGGNAAHVLAALLSSRHHVAMYAPYGDEAALLNAGSENAGGITAQAATRRWQSRPQRISAEPGDVFPGADLALLALPASAHAATLEALAPHVSPQTWVIALPARGGFDWEARSILGGGIKIAGLQTLPWACRIPPGGYGKRVDILGTKEVVGLAAAPAHLAPDLAASLSELLQVQLAAEGSFLALTLANTGQLIHPGIMYGLFRDWDGRPFSEDTVPLFYGGVTPEIAAHLQAMSAEVQAVKSELAAIYPEEEWEGVLPLLAWCRRSYAQEIADPSDLHTCFTTNRAYAGLRAPMRLVEENALAPWFESRYLTEDIPFGLLVTRGIAEILAVPTPAIDAVIHWAQDVLGRAWLVRGRLLGVDVAASRAPQRFAFTTPKQLLVSHRKTHSNHLGDQKHD